LILLGVWLNAADAMVTSTIMPSVARELGGWAWFGWAVAGYLLGSILAGASAGRISARFAMRPSMVAAALAYAVGCALSATAPNIITFLAGRMLQGIGGGWTVGLCYVAISAVFPNRLWPRLFGATAGVWGVATLLGPLIGGVFAGAGLWRWAFWFFSAQGFGFAIAAVLLLGGVPAEESDRGPFAWRTLVILATAISTIGAADLVSGRLVPLALILVGCGLFGIAARVNMAPGQGLLPADAANPFTTVGAGLLMMLAMTAASAVFSVYGAAILQTTNHLSPLVAGYIVAMEAAGWTATALVVSSQPERRHSALVLSGAGAIVLGLMLLSLTISGGVVWLVMIAAATMGAGFGLSWSLTTARILDALSPEDLAVGASAVPTVQLIGGAVGAALAGAVANLLGLTSDFTAPRVTAVGPWLFAAFVPLAIVGLFAALRLTLAKNLMSSRSG
jgi:MFS family permease